MKALPKQEIDAMARAIAEEMIPATELANDTAVRTARTVALLMERTAELRASSVGAELPLRFAERAISHALQALEAACATRERFLDTRIASIKVLMDIGGEGYGPQCPCRGNGVASEPEAARHAISLVA